MGYEASGRGEVAKAAGAVSQTAARSLLTTSQSERVRGAYAPLEEGEMLIRPNGSSVRGRGALCGPEDVTKIC